MAKGKFFVTYSGKNVRLSAWRGCMLLGLTSLVKIAVQTMPPIAKHRTANPVTKLFFSRKCDHKQLIVAIVPITKDIAGKSSTKTTIIVKDHDK